MSANALKMPRGGEFGKEIEAAEVDPWFLTQLNAALKSPLLSLPREHVTYMIDKVASSGFDIPVSQLQGFSQFLGRSATISASGETTTSVNTPVDLATVGPQLTGLPDGEYLILFGAAGASNSAAQNTFMGVKVNSTEPADVDTALTTSGVNVPLMRAVQKTLSLDGNNTLLARYYVGAASTATYYYRWLIALKIANA